MYISHPQFEYWLKQFYLSEDLLRSLRLICLSWSYLRPSPTTPILWNKGPYLLWAQHQSWSQSPSKHPTTSDTSESLTTPNIRTTLKSCSSTNLTPLYSLYHVCHVYPMYYVYHLYYLYWSWHICNAWYYDYYNAFIAHILKGFFLSKKIVLFGTVLIVVCSNTYHIADPIIYGATFFPHSTLSSRTLSYNPFVHPFSPSLCCTSLFLTHV